MCTYTIEVRKKVRERCIQTDDDVLIEGATIAGCKKRRFLSSLTSTYIHSLRYFFVNKDSSEKLFCPIDTWKRWKSQISYLVHDVCLVYVRIDLLEHRNCKLHIGMKVYIRCMHPAAIHSWKKQASERERCKFQRRGSKKWNVFIQHEQKVLSFLVKCDVIIPFFSLPQTLRTRVF